MKLQTIFNKVAKHLLTQNAKSDNHSVEDADEAYCLYRSPDGYKCAVGALIKDKYYSYKLENLNVQQEIVQKALKKSLDMEITDEVINLLVALQVVHDDSEPSHWEVELEEVANHFNLKPYKKAS